MYLSLSIYIYIYIDMLHSPNIKILTLWMGRAAILLLEAPEMSAESLDNMICPDVKHRESGLRKFVSRVWTTRFLLCGWPRAKRCLVLGQGRATRDMQRGPDHPEGKHISC